MANIPFLYGELNKQVEYLRYKFKSTDGSTFISQNDRDHTVDFSINTSNLVTLKQVRKDTSIEDDPIKYYSLFAYNANTKQYDIKLGDEIVIDTSVADENAQSIKEAYIIVGHKQSVDSEGNPLFDENGNPIMEPIWQKVKVEVDATVPGNLVLSQIPTSALIDYETRVDENGNIVEVPIQSILDGNSGGVY